MRVGRVLLAATVVTPKGTFYWDVLAAATEDGTRYFWERYSDFEHSRTDSGWFPTLHQAFVRADRDRCFFAEMWDSSTGVDWPLAAVA